jgi:hypothetical protein
MSENEYENEKWINRTSKQKKKKKEKIGIK